MIEKSSIVSAGANQLITTITKAVKDELLVEAKDILIWETKEITKHDIGKEYMIVRKM